MTQSPPTDSATPAAAAAAPARRRPLAYDRVALVLAALALLLIVILTVLQWRDRDHLADTRQELARRIGESDAAQRDVQIQTKQQRETVDALQAKIGVLEAKLAETQSQQMALDAMYQELSQVREDRLVAEIEQDIAVAAQQLQLAGNVEAALIALSGADARLARNGQPQFLPLRKLIERDIERLKALPGADISGLALKLDRVINAVPTLPLAFEQRPVANQAAPAAGTARKSGTASADTGDTGTGGTGSTGGADSAGDTAGPVAVGSGGETATAVSLLSTFSAWLRAWGSDVWGEVRQLVRIERIDRPDPGLLAPREVFFLRENLRLRLLSARLALLARDGRSFKSDLAQAQSWLDEYFDARAGLVTTSQATLTELARLDLVRQPAVLNETLSVLRNFKFGRDRSERGGTR